jgi:hypothetical protein
VKTLCEKLIKIDIMLSHVKLHKLSIVTRPKKQKYMQKNRVGSFLNIFGGDWTAIAISHVINCPL